MTMQIYSATVGGILYVGKIGQRFDGKVFRYLDYADRLCGIPLHFITDLTLLTIATPEDVVIKGVTEDELLFMCRNVGKTPLVVEDLEENQRWCDIINKVVAQLSQEVGEEARIPNYGEIVKCDKCGVEYPNVLKLHLCKEATEKRPPCQTCNADIHTKGCPYYGTPYSGVLTPQSPADQFFTEVLDAMKDGRLRFREVEIGQRQNDVHPEWCVVIQPKEARE